MTKIYENVCNILYIYIVFKSQDSCRKYGHTVQTYAIIGWFRVPSGSRVWLSYLYYCNNLYCLYSLYIICWVDLRYTHSREWWQFVTLSLRVNKPWRSHSTMCQHLSLAILYIFKCLKINLIHINVYWWTDVSSVFKSMYKTRFVINVFLVIFGKYVKNSFIVEDRMRYDSWSILSQTSSQTKSYKLIVSTSKSWQVKIHQY